MEVDIPQLERSARWMQQSFLDNFGECTWDEYTNDLYLIKQKIAFSLFGAPTEEFDLENLDETSTFGYTCEQLEFVIPLYEKIKSFAKYAPNQKSIYMSVIFVCVVPKRPEVKNIHLMDNLEFPSDKIHLEPVFRIRKCIKVNTNDGKLGCCFFIDVNGRIYKTWNDYLLNNKLKQGIIIAPENGRYSGECIEDDMHVRLQIVLSPSSKVGAKIKSGLEVASTVIAVGSVGVLASSFFVPVAGALAVATSVATVSTGIYGIGSSTHHLIDRNKHGENISLKDAQARGSWFNIAASSTGVIAGASSTLISKAASSGILIPKGLQLAHNTVLCTSLLTNGTSIINSYINFHMQYKKNKQLPSNLEIFQFASSILFFTHSIVSNRMAKTIIEDSQAAVINQYRDTLSNKQRKMFDKMSGETRRIQGTMNGNAEIIRSTKIISDNTNFFRDAARVNKDLNKNEVRISFKDGKALLNGEHTISPSDFYALDVEQRNTYLGSLGKVNLTPANASTRVSTIIKSDGMVLPIGTIVSTFIQVSQLIESFPDIAGNDEILLRYIARKLTGFVNNTETYNLFVMLINWLYGHFDSHLNESLSILDINGTNLFYKMFEACYEYMLGFIHEESGIPDTLRLFFRNGVIQEERVLGILNFFKQRIQNTISEYRSREIRCNVCDGITFCKD